MDRNLEAKIVKHYIVKRRQERTLFELARPDKRRDCVWEIGRDLNRCTMARIQEKFDGEEAALEFLYKAGICLSRCYVLSWTQEESNYVNLDKAVKDWFFSGPVIIINPKTGVGYFNDEEGVDYGRPFIPRRYLLRPTGIWS